MILKYLKRLLFALLSFMGFIGLYLLSAYVLGKISVEKEPTTSQDVTMYILTNGVHTDLVMPLRNEQMDWSQEVKFDNTSSKDTLAQYLAVGWGDKGFYLQTPTWADLKFSVAFKAATGLSTSAIHATFYKTMQVGNDCIELKISKEQYTRLVKYVKNSFTKDAQGHFMNIKTNANYSKNDAFYEAGGSYSMAHTCNTWANNGLKCCGQKAAYWTPFDSGIFGQYGVEQ
jgi:uncharacterized protein (TIGR02117 family)